MEWLTGMQQSRYKQQVIEFFNRRIAYDQEGLRHPLEANLLLESVPLQKGQRVLDIATGTGLISIPAAQRVGSEGYVIGVDMSPGMLYQAKQKIQLASIQNIELIETDADYINFENSSFDVIFCCSAITYLTDILITLQKWHRFLKTGGYVAFTCPAETAYMAPVQVSVCARLFGISLPHINEPLGTPEKCQSLLQKAGFRDIEIEIEQSGQYLSLSNCGTSWISGFYPRGNPKKQLSPEQFILLQVEYRAEIEKLATEEGVWQDTTTFFVRARK